MAKNLMVCSSSSKTLKRINESAGSGRYILQGTFAELDKLNRNKRIYPKDEYLKHLQYLRDDIKKGEPLLGELDHPDDRFEVKLKDASHRIIDLWYDAATNTVQGKIELLNTPNGLLAQSLVEMGIPLHISSRAAGTVNSDNTVSIQQIYTYDLVCKPGFASAVLHRVNESASNKYTDEMYKFFNKTEKFESKNNADAYGLNENFSVLEVPYGFNLRKEAKKIQENNELNTMLDKNKVGKIYEDDDEEKKVDDTENTENTENQENDEGGDDGVKIISVRGETSGDSDGEGVKIIKVKAETGSGSDEENSDGDKESEEGSDENSDEENSEENECKDETSECDKNCDKDEAKKPSEKEKEMLCDCDELKKKKETFEEKFDALVKNIKKKNDNKKSNESMTFTKYPMSSMLNESNFVEFMGLNESQKSKVIRYLNDNNICTPMGVNENWKNGINYVPEKEVWLKYAPSNYKKLFESAPKNVQSSIRNTASYLIFENQRDVNVFWENTGLMESSARKLVNEKYVNNMPKIVVESKSDNLPYGTDFINMITEMACGYNE